MFSENLKLIKHIGNLNRTFNYYSSNVLPNSEIDNIVDSKTYEGIIVYAEAINWEPIQRPHHLLKELSKKGFLCFFCVHDLTDDFVVKKIDENLYLINHQENLIPSLMNKNVIFYISYFLQYEFSKIFKNKMVWFDLLDRIDFFANYNFVSKGIWKELIKKADFITYSADNLLEFLPKRGDSILLPNAVRPEDFENIENVPEDLKPALARHKKIIGYYGALESWMDYDIIRHISKENCVVLIGKISDYIPEDFFSNENIFVLGPKPYGILKNYSSRFDMSIIPFIVNDLTNNVSPVKFFEYLAVKKPIISSAIKEMNKYNNEFIRIYHSIDELDNIINDLSTIDYNILDKNYSKILKENSWSERIKIVTDKIRRNQHE